MKTTFLKSKFDKFALIILFAVAGIFTLLINLYTREVGQHFIELAQSFLQGRLDLMYSAIDRGDVAAFSGKAYWPLGPLPALLLLPFVAVMGNAMTVGLLAIPLIIVTALFLWKILLKKGFNKPDSLWLVFAFIFASPYLGVAWVPRSWQFSHIVVVFFIIWALYEYYNKKRFWLIGIFFACILATRTTAALCISFFALEILWSYRKNIQKGIRYMSELGGPVLISLIILFIYNHLRFGYFLEFGYALANLGPDLNAMRSYGVLSLRHIPVNIYHSFLAPPSPSTTYPYFFISKWGMGIIYSAPYYLSLIWKRLFDKINIFLWVAVIVTLVPVLMYFGIGPYQLSFRYSLDFLPLLFLIFIRTVYASDKKLRVGYKVVIAIAFIVNFYLFAV